jgi:hypothetical protein
MGNKTMTKMGWPAMSILQGRADTKKQCMTAAGVDEDTYNPIWIFAQI